MLKLILIILAILLLLKGRKIFGCFLMAISLFLLLPLKAWAVLIFIIGAVLLFGE